MRNLLIRTVSGIVYVALMVAAVFTPWVAVPLAVFFIWLDCMNITKYAIVPISDRIPI